MRYPIRPLGHEGSPGVAELDCMSNVPKTKLTEQHAFHCLADEE